MVARPALRYVIGFLCALVVLIVAVTTLTVSSIFAGQAVDDIANRFSTALLVAARGKAQSYFTTPTAQIAALAVETRAPNSMLPSENPGSTPIPQSVFCTPFKTVMISAQYNYSSVDLQFDDQSYFRVMSLKYRNMVGCGLVSKRFDSPPSTTNVKYYYINNYSSVSALNSPNLLERVNTTRDQIWYQRYLRMKNILTNRPSSPAWMFFEAYGAGTSVNKLNLILGQKVYNSSDAYLGIASIAISVEPLSGFLSGLERTSGSQVFALYNGTMVLASTTGDQIMLSGRKTVGGLIYLNGVDIQGFVDLGYVSCWISEDAVDPAFEQYYCVRHAATFTYAPLKHIGQNRPEFANPSRTQSDTITVDGTSYFVGAEPVMSTAASFGLSILFFLPTDDVRGAVTDGRNIVIGVAAGVLVIATAVSVFVVFKILKPLEAVSTKMDNASRLQIDEVAENEANFSSIAEIAALQSSYANMAVAVSSFVKFVPRDVVLDLISSGELCKLGMQSVDASICFADILGFSEICQRVDPEQLANALVVYFEQMSGIIASHAGVVDKYIADGIMTLWNTPCITANHPLKATLCALMMNRETSLEPLRGTWDALGELLTIRVGVSTGICNAGNCGSSTRMSFTAIGDVVNLGARVCSLNRQFNTRIIIPGAVASKVQHIFLLRYLIPVQVVGKEEPVHIYEVVGLQQNLSFNDVFEREDNNALASASESRVSNFSNRTGGAAGQAAPTTTAVVSERAGAKISTRKMFARTEKLSHATLVGSDVEIEFCRDFSQAAEAFAQGDAQSCLQMIEVIKKKHPMFFDDVASVTGEKQKTTRRPSTNTNAQQPQQLVVESVGSPPSSPNKKTENNNNNNNASEYYYGEKKNSTNGGGSMGEDGFIAADTNNGGNHNNNNNQNTNTVKQLIEAIGNHKRCSACFIRADASANQLIKSCKYVLSLPNPDMYSFVMKASEK